MRLYKLVDDGYGSPIAPGSGHPRLIFRVGDTVEVKDANTDPLVACGPGVNVADLPWCMKEWRPGRRVMVVEFEAKDIACIPTATDGKIRLFRATVVAEKCLVDLGLVEAPKKKEVAANG